MVAADIAAWAVSVTAGLGLLLVALGLSFIISLFPGTNPPDKD